MRKYLLNFATSRFQESQLAANLLTRTYDIQLFSYIETVLGNYPDFLSRNAHILCQPRGYGYWLWKPFLILETLKQLQPGEILIYCDSGVLLIQDPEPLFELCLRHDQIFFSLPRNRARCWTKRDVFVKLGYDTTTDWDRAQITAQCHLWKHCRSSFAKLEEWLYYCQDASLITDSPSISPNLPEFIDHRHDQSILSLLVYKWGNEIFRDPSQNGNEFIDQFPNSNYCQLSLSVGAIQENKSLRL